ncbi:hypothetical protein DdX_16712 [Ditylenchus destructor]|uniref:Uncharacterized protein n=1 Tax=Ditylenchus destructor TaxID=166010 RepID=A0AAD4MT40_9BILA|nr:hypothetical protein DdX_16712 [Ditylenchus destructor]
MEIMFAIVSIALLFNANVVLSSESSYSSESPYYASGSSYSSDSASTSSSESDDASDIGESGSQSVSTSAEDDVESDTPMLQPFPIRIQHHLPFSNVFVPYDVGKRHKIDRSDPYMGYAPTSSNGNRHYIRVSDSFDCDNDVAIFDFVMCYMANFGFSHGWGGVGATPKVVAKKFGKRWIVGLEVINKLIVQHTKCDLIEHMSNPGNATNNRLCSAKEPASGKTRHRNKKKHGSGLMDHDGDDESSEDNSESDELSNSDELGIEGDSYQMPICPDAQKSISAIFCEKL